MNIRGRLSSIEKGVNLKHPDRQKQVQDEQERNELVARARAGEEEAIQEYLAQLSEAELEQFFLGCGGTPEQWKEIENRRFKGEEL